MAFYGPFTSNPQIRQGTRYDINVGSTNVQTVGQVNLGPTDAGHYLLTCGYGPSESTNQYPNNDYDDWAARCYYNGVNQGDTLFGNEDAPVNYRNMNFGTWSINHTGGNANLEMRFSKQYGDDPDGGGMRGFAYISIHRLTSG